eukprot:jgi/Ulvmu1/6087/UM027_0065.1
MAGPDDIFELDDELNEPRCSSQEGQQRQYGKQDKQFLNMGRRATPNSMATSIPISIPAKLKRSALPDNSPSATEFIPPHQLSQQSHSQLAQSVPLTSSAQLRTRDLLMSATGMLPRHGTAGSSSRRGALAPSADNSVPEDSVSAALQARSGQHRWDSFSSSSTGVHQCAGGLSAPGREFHSYLRKTTPMERHPRQFAIVPEGC